MNKLPVNDKNCVFCKLHSKDLIEVRKFSLGGTVWICKNCFSNFCKKHNYNDSLPLNYIEILGAKESIDIGKILFFPEGTQGKLPCGLMKKENFCLIEQCDRIRIFWKIDKKNDKSAVAIFPSKSNVSGDDQIGWMPRWLAKDVVNNFKKEYSIIVKVDYLDYWYRDSDFHCDYPHVTCRLILHCYVPKTAPFDERLGCRARVRYEAVKCLLNMGIDSPEKIMDMRDSELLKIKHVGRVALSRIREEFSCG